MSSTALELDAFDLSGLLAGCIENLREVYDERRAVFPYSTRLVDGSFVNDYDHPQVIRYTINTLLGFGEAARAGTAGVTQAELDGLVSSFLERQLERVETPADLGLLTLLLTEYGDPEGPAVGHALGRLESLLSGGDPRHLNMQDLAWITWGACSGVRHGRPQAEQVAAASFSLISSEYVDPQSGLPRHSTRRYRRGIVSFGSLVYFLRAAHEYGATFADRAADDLFSRGVQRAIDVQGPLGEWPWMLDVRSAKPFDVYPVFSVHQDSMAMLFLLPAHDGGAPRTKGAIERSIAWGFGANELSIDFYPRHPFHAYRSIERAEGAPRIHRYARSVIHSFSGRPAAFGGARVRLNAECRSYHLGWVLFAWAGRPEARSDAVHGPSQPSHASADHS